MNLNYRQKMMLGFLVLIIGKNVFSEQLHVHNEMSKKYEELQRKKLNEYRKLHDGLPALEITGRVVDQYHDPVPGAKVTINWLNADELLGKPPKWRKEIVKTDVQGKFSLRCDKVIEADAEAEKDGYAPLAASVSGLVLVKNQMPEVVPVVLSLRKKGPPTFLLVREGASAAWAWMYTNKTGKVSMGLLAKCSGQSGTGQKREDLIAEVHYDATNNTWSVVYSGPPGDGIIYSEQCLYEAPEAGYTNLVSLSVPRDQLSAKCFLYLRSRLPVTFSRVELEHRANASYPEEGYQFRIYLEKICVNPYGERNFEYDERFEKSWRAREELAKEAVAALAEGRYPQKCEDVPARIKEAERRK